jgi:hypothetical protein
LEEEPRASSNVPKIPHPSLGIDLDGCGDEAQVFFSISTNVWPGKVYVITLRDDKEKAAQVLKKDDVRSRRVNTLTAVSKEPAVGRVGQRNSGDSTAHML